MLRASLHTSARSLSLSTPGKYIHTPSCRDQTSPRLSFGFPQTATSGPSRAANCSTKRAEGPFFGQRHRLACRPARAECDFAPPGGPLLPRRGRRSWPNVLRGPPAPGSGIAEATPTPPGTSAAPPEQHGGSSAVGRTTPTSSAYLFAVHSCQPGSPIVRPRQTSQSMFVCVNHGFPLAQANNPQDQMISMITQRASATTDCQSPSSVDLKDSARSAPTGVTRFAPALARTSASRA